MTHRLTLVAHDGTPFDAYVALPDGVAPPDGVGVPSGAPRGGLVLIHEIWGLVPHIEDVADRYAAEGYLVIAPDILSHGGVTPRVGEELFAIMSSPSEAVRTEGQPRLREAFSVMRAPDYAEWAVGALRAAVDWLQDAPDVDGRIGVTGFCFGGTYSFALAADDDRIRAAVPFYGTAPDAEAITRIHAPILAIYGAHDPALIDALPEVRALMAAAHVDFQAVVYPDAAHAFFNDTGARYREQDAADAWRRVLAFFADHLR